MAGDSGQGVGAGAQGAEGRSGGRAALWASPDRAAGIADAIEAAGLEIVAVGCAERGRASELAHEIGGEAMPDLRAGLAGVEADVFVLGSAGEFGASGEGSDAAAVTDARRRGVVIAAIEPVPASATELFSSGWTRARQASAPIPIEGVRAVGLMRRSAAAIEAREHIAELGTIRSARVVLERAAGARSAGALLFDAIDSVNWLMGEPELVHGAVRADHVPSNAAAGLRLRGAEIAALLRYSDGRWAQVCVSDGAGRLCSEIRVASASGSLVIGDEGFEYRSADGALLDEFVASGDQASGLAGWQVRIADSLRRIVRSAEEGRFDADTVLCSTEAILLSVKTGAGERPGTVRRALAGG